ncbi:hypothetical protein ACLQ2Q_00390 [Microbacterium sp. DT81.1]|uniref:hypothetical protein n=1 Tax=Microbacterium sp. DT81.1 TaxID=3393413 RepID=UPI003CE96FFD
MAEGGVPGRSRRSLRIAGSVAIGVAALAGLALVASYVVPPVLLNLRSTVADGSAVALRADSSRGEVVPPEGWIISRPPWTDAAVEVRSPDLALTVLVSVSAGNSETALALLRDGAAGPVRVETLTSGRTVRHADAEGGRVLAAVDVDGGVVSVDARVADAADAAAYRAALAELLAGIGP